MSLITLIITLVILGFVLYILNLIPIDGTIKKIIQAVVVLFIVLWVIQQLGFVGPVLR